MFSFFAFYLMLISIAYNFFVVKCPVFLMFFWFLTNFLHLFNYFTPSLSTLMVYTPSLSFYT